MNDIKKYINCQVKVIKDVNGKNFFYNGILKKVDKDHILIYDFKIKDVIMISIVGCSIITK